MDIKIPLKTSLVLTAFLSYLFMAVSFPLTGHSDTKAHLDYAWQLSQGNTPDFYGGTTLPYNVRRSDIQFAAHHPPLYYKLIAPLVGYQIGNKHTFKEVVLGTRLVNILVSLATLILIAIYAKHLDIFKHHDFDIYFLITFAYFLPFAKVSSLVFNESLLILLITIGWISSIKILKSGYNSAAFIMLLASSALGLYTKVSYLPVLLLTLTLMYLGMIMSDQDSRVTLSKLAKPTIPVVIIIVSVILVTGWFYYGNYEQSGSFIRAAPQSWIADYDHRRDYKSFQEVITNEKMWGFIITSSFFPGLDYIFRKNVIIAAIAGINLIAYITSIIYLLKGYRDNSIDSKRLMLSLAFLLSIVAVFLQMIIHATGYGAYNPRYLLPALIAIAALIASGLLKTPKIDKYLICAYFLFGNMAVLGYILYRNQALFHEFQWFQVFRFSAVIQQNQDLPAIFIDSILIAWPISIVISLILLIKYFSYHER